MFRQLMDPISEQAERRVSFPSTIPGRSTLHDPAALNSSDLNGPHGQDIQNLQLSQVALSIQVAELTAEVQRTKQLAQETDGIVRGPSSMSERSLQRAILFANIAAAKVLEAPHPELSKSYAALGKSNSIRQITLRSRQTDCTLFDIRLMISYFMRQCTFKCAIYPSPFNAMYASTAQISTIEIAFENFSGICDALQLSSDRRESGVYRERAVNYSSSRILRRVQVLGVDTTSDRGSYTERKIILARIMLTPQDKSGAKVYVLHQKTTNFEHSSWEEGFLLRENKRDALLDFKIPVVHDLDEPIPEDSRGARKRKRRNAPATNVDKAFVIRWDRCTDSPHPSNADAQLFPGTLCLFFPAVVIRTIKLTKSVQLIFDKATNGTTLQNLLCSSEGEEAVQ